MSEEFKTRRRAHRRLVEKMLHHDGVPLDLARSSGIAVCTGSGC
jgi:hypothetical protein